jgi:L-lactate dehydrogenase complex protein LldG
MERAAFLERVRRSLSQAPPASAAHPPPDVDEVAPACHRRSLDDWGQAFLEEAAAHGAEARRVASPEELAGLLAEMVHRYGVERAVVSPEPETVGIAPLLAGLGVDVLPGDGASSAAAADLGVTGATAGIAATGSIVVDAARAGGRSVSLLPPVHLALVDAERLLPTTAAFWRHLGDHFPEGVPSQVVVITGPSKTADIGQVLVTGAHGPGHLWVALIGC